MAFADLIPELPAIELLQRSLRHQRIGHAYLFSGSIRASLELAAMALAKAVNCRKALSDRTPSDALSSDFCDHCDSCIRIGNHLHGDIQWIRPESKSRVITIDQVRRMVNTLALKPNDAEVKVWIMVDADRMNAQAANAFLKTLEEPPGSTLMILLTTQKDRLLDTIRSRCLSLHFSGDSMEAMRKHHAPWLEDFVRMLSAEHSDMMGRYRALGVLTSKLATSRASIEESMKERFLDGLSSEVEASFRKRREDEMKAAVEAEYRRVRTDHLSAFQWWLRDLWLSAEKGSAHQVAFPSLVPEQLRWKPKADRQALLANIELLEDLQRTLLSNVQEALALEVHLLKIQL